MSNNKLIISKYVGFRLISSLLKGIMYYVNSSQILTNKDNKNKV